MAGIPILGYGNYCGGGYCGGKFVGSSPCTFDVPAWNDVDAICMQHDLAYESSDPETRRHADELFVDSMLQNGSVAGIGMAAMIKAKNVLEDIYRGALRDKNETLAYQSLAAQSVLEEQSSHQDVGMLGSGNSKGDGPIARPVGSNTPRRAKQGRAVAVARARGAPQRQGAPHVRAPDRSAFKAELLPMNNRATQRHIERGSDFWAAIPASGAGPAWVSGNVVFNDVFSVLRDSTRLKLVAQGWQKYRIRKLVARYVPSCPVTDRGQIIVFWDTDPTDDMVATGAAAVNVAYAHGGSPIQISQPVSCPMPIDNGGMLFVGTTGDERLLYQGQLFVLCAADISTTASIGDIYVDYEVEFMTPQIEGLVAPTNGPVLSTDHVAFKLTGDNAITAGAFKATDLEPYDAAGFQNQSWATYSGNVITLAKGKYHIVFTAQWLVAGASTALFDWSFGANPTQGSTTASFDRAVTVSPYATGGAAHTCCSSDFYVNNIASRTYTIGALAAFTGSTLALKQLGPSGLYPGTGILIERIG
jgi:hypothetical protein